MANPTVSVLIPAYNGERTVGRAIDSVLTQDYPDIDLLVVDDCSSDETPEVLAGYHRRVRLVHNRINSGIARTYNRAIAETNGEIVLMLACDCALASTDYVSRLVGHFQNPSVGAVAGKAVIADFASVPSIERIFARLNILDINDPDTEVHEVNFVEVRCDGFRRKVLESVGGLNEDLFRSNEDQDLSIRITKMGYRLLQDNALEFHLGFGGTEDSTGKLLAKQGQYARGQAYISVNYGVGSRDGLWSNPNRRRRALHRMSQVAALPLGLILALVAGAWPKGWMLLAAVIAARVWYYVGLATGLRTGEKLLAAPLGLACDLIYSACFLWSASLWVMRGKSALKRGKGPAGALEGSK